MGGPLPCFYTCGRRRQGVATAGFCTTVHRRGSLFNGCPKKASPIKSSGEARGCSSAALHNVIMGHGPSRVRSAPIMTHYVNPGQVLKVKGPWTSRTGFFLSIVFFLARLCCRKFLSWQGSSLNSPGIFRGKLRQKGQSR